MHSEKIIEKNNNEPVPCPACRDGIDTEGFECNECMGLNWLPKDVAEDI